METPAPPEMPPLGTYALSLLKSGQQTHSHQHNKNLPVERAVSWTEQGSDGSTIGSVIVEVWEEPTRHVVHVKKLLSWLKAPGKFPPEEQRKAKLRVLAK